MRRTPKVLAVLALAATLGLTGCSKDKKEEPKSIPVAKNVDCSTLTIDKDSSALPTITGDYGAEPTIKWSGEKAPENLTVKTLKTGDGAEVAKGSSITVNYVGWQWDGAKPFESSFSFKKTASFSVDGVITGWRCGLPGTHVGDRLLMSIPAQYAYGTDAASGFPTGSLVFVVDVVGTESITDINSGTKNAVMEGAQQIADRGLTVSGDLGGPAKISVNEGAAEPTQNEFFVLARGTGEAITETSNVVVQNYGTSWDNKETYSTWDENHPLTILAGTDEIIKGFVGVPVGSRVVALIPGDANSGTPSMARVIDLERLG
ncbi:FK506-binding protein [Actinomyces bovis]|uniref:Peptidyl-prolyl cis-trans isomerase n=1 Tax=Actinomyces bovis TaxID=1658 RepID=A0ABY1VK22_9ACTO|nr:FKBP-type peptidyl-prolyl cis-trans isomerase [Actinomyces bovis]SPT52459.1 FK506-binding protein [Actinomyces bovis]VEG54129.1 FK506-binding protein [Actinomyces israelii]